MPHIGITDKLPLSPGTRVTASKRWIRTAARHDYISKSQERHMFFELASDIIDLN